MKRQFTFLSFVLVLHIFIGVGDVSAQVEVQGNQAAKSAIQPVGPDNRDVLYRKVQVRESDLDDVLKGYIPLERDRFDEILNEINESSDSSLNMSTTRIKSAQYRATLRQNVLASGVATWQIQHKQDEPSLLRVSPLSMAVTQPQWIGDTVTDAVLGWKANDSWNLLVNMSGQVRCGWSTRGVLNRVGDVRFDLAFPIAERTTLLIDMAETLAPVLSSGVVTEVGLAEEIDTDDDVDDLSDPPIEEGMRRWLIELGATSRSTLLIRSATAQNSSEKLSFISENLSYTVTDTGINLDAVLTLDVNGDPLDRLELLVGGGLFIRTATVDQKRITLDHHGEDLRSVDLVFSEPLTGPGNEIRVSAIAPLVSNRPFALPAVTSLNVVWRQGQQHLGISDQVQINSIKVSDAVPLAPIEPWSEFDLVRSYQMNQPSAQIVLEIYRKEQELRTLQHSLVRIDPEELNAECRLDLSTDHGRVFEFRAVVEPNWSIDVVDRVSGAEIKAFQFEDGILRVTFEEPISSDNPTEIMVRCRKPISGYQFEGTDLRILEPVALADSLATGSLLVDPALRLSVSNDSALQRIPIVDEESSPVVLSYRVNQGLDQSQFRIRPVESRYAVESLTTVLFESLAVKEQFQVSIVPESNPVGRIEFQLSGDAAEEIQWQLADSDSTNQISAQLIPGVVGGGRWEVVFREPVTEPLMITGTSEGNNDSTYTVPLIRVPDASNDSSRVVISAQQGVRLEIDSVGVAAEYPETIAQGEFSQQKAFFRYQSSQPGSIKVTRLDESSRRMHWAWSHAILLTVNPHGEVQHDETFNIENNGDQFFSVQLSSGADLQTVTVNGVPIQVPPGQPTTENRLIFDLPLPPLERFVRLQLRYRTEHSELSRITPLRVPVATASCLVMRSHWTVAVPPGFESAGGIAANSLSGRLFGPWIKNNESQPFNLFKSEDWHHFFGMGKRHDATPAVAAGIAAELEAAFEDENKLDRSVTWADWLARYNRYAVRPGNEYLPLCLVDIVELDRAGITASSYISKPNSTERDGVTDVLNRENLVLLLVDSKLVLTRRASIVELDADSQSAWILESDGSYPLEFLIGQQYLMPSDWTEIHSRFDLRSIETGDVTGEIAQWQFVSGSLLTNGLVNVRLYHETTSLAVCWAVFLISLGGLIWLGTYRRHQMVYVVAGLAAVCIVSPTLMFPMLSYVFMASLVAVFWTHAIGNISRQVKELQSGDDNSDAEFTLQWVPKVMRGLLWTAALSVTASALAQPKDASRLPTVYDVYFPIDADDNPTGKYVYLPEEFYTTLHKRTAMRQSKQSEWMITKAEYELDWSWDSNLGQFFDQQLAMRYTIESMATSEPIVLPLLSDQLRVDEVRVNGEVVPVQWNPQGTGLIIESVESSTMDVELSATPNISARNQLMGLKCDVPRVPDSVLRVVHPQESPEVKIATSQGAVNRDEGTGQSVVQLGTAGVLDLMWSTGFDSGDSEAVVAVDEYFWMDVDPHSVTVDARFGVEVIGGQINYLEFMLDHDVRTIKSQVDGMIDELEIIQDQDSNRLYVTLKEPQSGRFNLDLKFYLHEHNGTGSIRKPGIIPVGARIGSRWIAATVSSRLQWSLDLSASETRVTPNAFADAWGGETLPTLAFTSTTGESAWQLKTAYQVPQTHVTQQSTMVVQREFIMVEYEAAINTFRGGALQYHLNTPSDFFVESLSMLQDGAPISVNYVDSPRDDIYVFLDRPVVGEHKIVIRGRVLVSNASQPIPSITINDSSLLSDRVVIQRPADVITTLENLSDGSVLISELSESTAGFGTRVFAEISNDTGDPVLGEISVAPNQVEFRAGQVTELIRDDTNWLSRTQFSLDVLDGVLDVIRLRVPDDWDTQLEIQPQMQVKLQPSLEQGRMELLLVPKEAITVASTFEFSVQRRLIVPEGGVSVPRIQVLDAQSNGQQSYVALPRKLDQRTIQWRVSQLQPIQQWTTSLMNPAINPQSHEVYLASPVAWTADLFDVEDPELDPRVSISNHSILLDPSSGIQGSAWFVVEPSNNVEVSLAVPQGTSLVSVLVGNISVEPEKVSRTEYRIPLLTPYSPQLIRVIYHHTFQVDNRGLSSLVLDLPRISNVAVSNSLLSIGVTGESKLLSIEGAGNLSTEDYHITQLDGLNDVLESAIDIATVHSSVTLQREVQSWSKHFADVGRGASRLIADSESRKRIDEAVARHQQLVTSVIADQQLSETNSIVYQDWVWTNNASNTLQTASLESPQVTVRIEFAHSSEQGIWITLFMLSIVGVLAFGFHALSTHVLTTEWLQYSPRILMALAGMAWWMWLSPSLFGLFIVAVSLLSQFVPGRVPKTAGQISTEVSYDA